MSSGEHLITLAQLKALDPQHPGIGLLTGRTPLFACQADQRFSAHAAQIGLICARCM